VSRLAAASFTIGVLGTLFGFTGIMGAHVAQVIGVVFLILFLMVVLTRVAAL
jgi:hypothetical protein